MRTKADVFSKSRREELALGPVKHNRKSTAVKARITVTIRKRPLTPEEAQRGETDVIDVLSKKAVILREARKELSGNDKTTMHEFKFDRVYDNHCDNLYIYNSCVKKLVDTVFQEGTKCSCFAFGQTGSGKTYTMMGPRRRGAAQRGLWEWAAKDIMGWMSRPAFKPYKLVLSFFEIHCNRAYDLLNERTLVRPLESSDGGVVVKDLTQVVVTTEQEMLEAIERGNNARSTGRNSKNAESSRSHAILSIEVVKSDEAIAAHKDPRTRPATSGSTSGTESRGQRDHTHAGRCYGKIAFIDLAGSERGADTVQFGRPAQQDGAGINKSLLALKECIRAMDQGKGHIPFRDSELTKVLRDFFTNANGLCLMIATTASASGCVEQTLNTLRYAQRFIAVRQNAEPCINEPDVEESDVVVPEGVDDEDEEDAYLDEEDDLPEDELGDDLAGQPDLVDDDNSSSGNDEAFNPPKRGEMMDFGSASENNSVSSNSLNKPAAPRLQQTAPRKIVQRQTDNFIKDLEAELEIDLERLLEDTADPKCQRIIGLMAAEADDAATEDPRPEHMDDKQLRKVLEKKTSDVWVLYKDLLSRQTVYLKDVCQLIQGHVRICRRMDSDLEKSRPSISNPAVIAAKTAAINPQILATSRMFLEREIGSLLNLAQDLHKVEALIQNTKALEKEERRRTMQNVQLYDHKSTKRR